MNEFCLDFPILSRLSFSLSSSFPFFSFYEGRQLSNCQMTTLFEIENFKLRTTFRCSGPLQPSIHQPSSQDQTEESQCPFKAAEAVMAWGVDYIVLTSDILIGMILRMGVLADVAINREERAFCDDGGVD